MAAPAGTIGPGRIGERWSSWKEQADRDGVADGGSTIGADADRTMASPVGTVATRRWTPEGKSKMRRIIILTALGALLAVGLAACGGGGEDGGGQAPTSAVSTERAQAIAQNMLVAYNSGNYQAFSRDWAGPVKRVIGEGTFQEFRQENLPVTGPFKTITSVTPTPGQQDPNHVSYQVTARFDQHDSILFTMTLSADGAKVEGVEFHSQS
jgi:hypothetical protein